MPSPPHVSDELDDELSRVAAAFASSSLEILDATSPVTVHLDARAPSSPHFCAAVVTAVFPDSYPASPVSLSVSKPRGLDKTQAAALAATIAAAAVAGAPAHPALAAFRAAVDFLSCANTPGECVVCGKRIVEHTESADAVVLKPCLHACHRLCVDAMKTERMRTRRAMEARLSPNLGTAEAERVAGTECAKHGGCPTCTEAAAKS
jgi:hypothetical protein